MNTTTVVQVKGTENIRERARERIGRRNDGAAATTIDTTALTVHRGTSYELL